MKKIFPYLIVIFFCFLLMGQDLHWSDMTVNYPTSLDDTTSLWYATTGDTITYERLNQIYRVLYLLETKVGITADSMVINYLTGKTDNTIYLNDTLSFTTRGVLKGLANLVGMDSVETDSLVVNTYLQIPWSFNLTTAGLDSSVLNTGDTLCIGRADADFTIDTLAVFCTKPAPSFTFQIYHGTSAPGLNTALFSSAQSVSAKNTTNFTSFNDATINKGEWIHIVFATITTKPKNVGLIAIGTRD